MWGGRPNLSSRKSPGPNLLTLRPSSVPELRRAGRIRAPTSGEHVTACRAGPGLPIHGSELGVFNNSTHPYLKSKDSLLERYKNVCKESLENTHHVSLLLLRVSLENIQNLSL